MRNNNDVAPLVRFTVGQCSLGSILLAATAKGVCAILIGDDHGLLKEDLQTRFPRSTLSNQDDDLAPFMAKVLGMVESPLIDVDLPLDMQGTAFQQRVWQALRNIPAGTTVSYSELAHRLGAPKSARAIAQACAANKIAVVIPCHRVVRNDGAISGYRWGVERKRTLLEREAQK